MGWRAAGGKGVLAATSVARMMRAERGGALVTRPT